MSKVIEGLYYAESHEYVKVDGDYAYIGITDYAQHALGNIVYVICLRLTTKWKPARTSERWKV